MIVGRIVSALVAAASATLLVACSSAEDAGACVDLIQVMTDGTDSIAAAVEDPATAGEQLRAFAVDLRSESSAASDAIGAAAEDLATFYEQMADDIEAGGVPDMSTLSARIGALQEACT